MLEVGFVRQELRRHFPILRTSHITLHTSQNSNLSVLWHKKYINIVYIFIFLLFVKLPCVCVCVCVLQRQRLHVLSFVVLLFSCFFIDFFLFFWTNTGSAPIYIILYVIFPHVNYYFKIYFLNLFFLFLLYDLVKILMYQFQPLNLLSRLILFLLSFLLVQFLLNLFHHVILLLTISR